MGPVTQAMQVCSGLLGFYTATYRPTLKPTKVSTNGSNEQEAKSDCLTTTIALLNRIASTASMQCLMRAWCVCVCVSVNRAKTAKPIDMPFGVRLVWAQL